MNDILFDINFTSRWNIVGDLPKDSSASFTSFFFITVKGVPFLYDQEENNQTLDTTSDIVNLI